MIHIISAYLCKDHANTLIKRTKTTDGRANKRKRIAIPFNNKTVYNFKEMQLVACDCRANSLT